MDNPLFTVGAAGAHVVARPYRSVASNVGRFLLQRNVK